ncbi:MAG: TIR domain-containing protein [Alphaproteobacteria bacterium]|nr:TIR domain-containing protein [Alphaproteobacteria bacterium]
MSEQLQEALRQSENLIVACSPKAAESEYVNEEIRYFQSLGRGRNIYAIVVSGEPGQRAEETFPSALCHRTETSGRFIPSRIAEVFAADVRIEADGWHLAKLKVVAALLGLDLNQLRRREAVAERRRRYIWTGVAASTSALAVAAGGFGVYALQQYDRAERNLDRSVGITVDFADVVEKSFGDYQLPAPQADRLLSDLDARLTELETAGNPNTYARRMSKAKMMLSLHSAKKRIRSLYEAGKLAHGAKRIFADLRQEALFAGAIPGQLATLMLPDGWSDEVLTGLARSSLALGLVKRDQAELADAVDEMEEAQEYFAALAQRNPHLEKAAARTAWSNLADAHYQLGEALERNNQPRSSIDNFNKALQLYQTVAHATEKHVPSRDGQINRQLAKARLNVTRAQVELSEAIRNVGLIDEQFRLLHEALTTRSQLLRADPKNRRLKRFFAWAHLFRGEAHMEAGDVEKAIADFETTVGYQKQGLDFDPQNTQRKKDYAWARGFLGTALLRAGEYEKAIANINRAVSVTQADNEQYDSEPMKRRNFAFWLSQRASAWRQSGEFEKARQDLKEAEGLLKPVELIGTYAIARAEMAFIQREFGLLDLATGHPKRAHSRLQAARDRYRKLIDEAPESTLWPQRLAEIDDAVRQQECSLANRSVAACLNNGTNSDAGRMVAK